MTPQQPLKLVCDLCFTNDTRLRKPGGQGRTHHNRLAWSFWKRTERGPQAVVKGGPGREAVRAPLPPSPRCQGAAGDWKAQCSLWRQSGGYWGGGGVLTGDPHSREESENKVTS